MMSAYFAGYAVGALLLPRVVASAGHIRAFAGFAAIASAVTIAPVLLIATWVSVALRPVTALVYAGMILVAERLHHAHAVISTPPPLLSLSRIFHIAPTSVRQRL